MITSFQKIYKKVHLVVAESPHGFEIQMGELSDPQAFKKGQTILITGENPNLLWDLLHDLVGIPYPLLNPVKPPEETKAEGDTWEDPPVAVDPLDSVENDVFQEMSPLEIELNAMSSREIILKVAKEKGVAITLSPKSKKAIIKRALTLYS